MPSFDNLARFDRLEYFRTLLQSIWVGLLLSRNNLTYLLFCIGSKQMNAFRNFFPFAFSSTPDALVDRSLNEFQITSNASLPDNYYNTLYPTSDKFLEMFSEVVKNISKATNSYALVKLLTIVLKSIREKDYEIEVLEIIEKIEMPLMADLDQRENSWVWDLTIAIRSYLARLSSMEDVYQRALSLRNKKGERSPNVYLSDLHRLLNVYGLLFPGLTASLNIIGRYYLKTSPYYQQFYKIIKQEILLGYDYLECIVSYFKQDFKGCDVCTIDCFLKTVPEIQLYCDKVEEFLMNKYFKGKGPSKKIYIKQEQINEIAFQIQSLEVKSTKSEQIVHTSDEDDFGEFQH